MHATRHGNDRIGAGDNQFRRMSQQVRRCAFASTSAMVRSRLDEIVEARKGTTVVIHQLSTGV